jgi:hypothetical protein
VASLASEVRVVGMRILVVEDEKKGARFIKKGLKEGG